MKNLAVPEPADLSPVAEPEPIDLDALNPPKVVEGTVLRVVDAVALPVRTGNLPRPPVGRSTESLVPVTLAFLALLFWAGLCLSIIWGVL